MPSIIIEEFFQRTTELTSHFLGTSLPIHSITHTLWTGCKLKNSVKDHHVIGKPAGFRRVDQHNQLEKTSNFLFVIFSSFLGSLCTQHKL